MGIKLRSLLGHFCLHSASSGKQVPISEGLTLSTPIATIIAGQEKVRNFITPAQSLTLKSTSIMSNIQYAVCHLQKGSGNDSGMACHIERKNAKGEVYLPNNADPSRTHLNRELITFPPEVTCRTEAIKHRIDKAELHRKVGKNQVKAIRIMLTGTHEQMMKLANGGLLDKWISANLLWVGNTFG